MPNIANKLLGLGYRPLEPNANLLKDDEENVGSKLDFQLPEDYRQFMSEFPWTGVFDRQIAFSGVEKSPWVTDGEEILEVLYGVCTDPKNDLLELRRRYSDQLSDYFLVIGEVTGANLICLDLRKASLGRVFVWDHEHMGDIHEGFYLVADNFSSFIELLHDQDPKTSEGLPKLKKMDLSSSLNARVAELLKNNK